MVLGLKSKDIMLDSETDLLWVIETFISVPVKHSLVKIFADPLGIFGSSFINGNGFVHKQYMHL